MWSYNTKDHLKQIPNIGPALCQMLNDAGIESLLELENASPAKIDLACNRNHPFGENAIRNCLKLPRFQLEIRQSGENEVIIGVFPLFAGDTSSSFKPPKCKLTLFGGDPNGNLVFFFPRIS